ncbi:MAG: YDG domain-containing protein, partial [Rubrivivax sp.]
SDGTVGRAANYLLASPSAQSSASITPRPLSVSGVTVAPKVYDGSTAATASGGTLTGLVAGEDLTVALTAAAFADAHAGTGKVVTGQASLVSGSRGLASNYSLSAGWVASGDISPRPLTLGVPTGVDKVYDGSLAGQLVGGSLVGLVAGDDLTLSFSGVRFASANAATGLRVTGNATLGDGTRGRAADYQLLNPLAESRASITPRPLTLSGVSIAPKVYDGSVAASAQGGTLTGLVAGEDLSVVHAEASFDNPNVGTGKAVTGQASLASGARGLAANYSLSGAWQAVGDISARPLTLAGVTATSKVYDGTVQAQVSGGALEGLLPGQSLLVTQLRGQFADAQAGTGKAVSVTAQLADAAGGLASNYRLTAVATP